MTATASFPGIAAADWVTHSLANPVNAVPGFVGNQNFLATDGTRFLDVTVDYKVFQPGTFSAPYTPFSGFSPPNPGDYVYAYQIYNRDPAHGGLSGSTVSQLGIDVAALNIGSVGKNTTVDPAPPAVDPTAAFLTPTGVSYLFLVPTINPGEYSVLLLIASPQFPQYAQATTLDHGLSATGQLPVPVPEPVTGVLALMGFAMARRSLRRR